MSNSNKSIQKCESIKYDSLIPTQSLNEEIESIIISNNSNLLVPSIYHISYGKDVTLKSIQSLTDTKLDNIDYNFLETQFPLFSKSNVIYTPKKVLRVLERHIPKSELKAIDKDINVAIEKCLLVLSNLSSTFYSENKWKSLHSSILHEQTKKATNNTYIYKKILNVLLKGTENTGSIIEVYKNDDTESYYVGAYTKKYKLSDTYLKAGLTKYEIKTTEVKNKRENMFWKLIKDAMVNPIAKHLIDTYTKIQLPSKEEILAEAKRLVSEGYKTKKGKTLTFRNNHTDSYFKDASSRSFVEDNIELFDYLTSEGLMVPIISGEASGNRVYDSINLMPSWIRSLIKIDNEVTSESDYTALHPNLAINIYEGDTKFISHKQVAQNANIEVKTAKIEHLSFFNKPFTQMANSPLFDFYNNTESKMMQNIYWDKKDNGYKNTSKRLFTLEVDIMIEVIERL
jgi:hypothetical protein